ncbi:hypothetical protein [Nocardioides pakistanensis]
MTLNHRPASRDARPTPTPPVETGPGIPPRSGRWWIPVVGAVVLAGWYGFLVSVFGYDTDASLVYLFGCTLVAVPFSAVHTVRRVRDYRRLAVCDQA